MRCSTRRNISTPTKSKPNGLLVSAKFGEANFWQAGIFILHELISNRISGGRKDSAGIKICVTIRICFQYFSLMVEELAKWKAALCQRTTDLQEAIKRLLEEHSKVRETTLRTYRYCLFPKVVVKLNSFHF